MEKAEYLYLRNTNDTISIVYEFYREGGGILINKQEFVTYIMLWGQINIYISSIYSYYDTKFKVMTISNKQGQIIRYE